MESTVLSTDDLLNSKSKRVLSQFGKTYLLLLNSKSKLIRSGGQLVKFVAYIFFHAQKRWENERERMSERERGQASH